MIKIIFSKYTCRHTFFKDLNILTVKWFSIFKQCLKIKANSAKKCGWKGLPAQKKLHYENMFVQYTAIFHGCKTDNFQMKFFYIFLIFAQMVLIFAQMVFRTASSEAVLTSTHNLCFRAKIRK